MRRSIRRRRLAAIDARARQLQKAAKVGVAVPTVWLPREQARAVLASLRQHHAATGPAGEGER